MEGRIYIAGAFTTVVKSKCGQGKDWIDNDPHFWTNPPTWGICRTDFRRTVKIGDYVFYVLPINAELPQMVFAYMKVLKKISHIEAYHLTELRSKRMGNKPPPNGNIIVNSTGKYNKYDMLVHRSKFEEIKDYYIIGEPNNSRLLKEKEILALKADFMKILKKIFNQDGQKPFDIINRSGRRMTEDQVLSLLNWLT